LDAFERLSDDVLWLIARSTLSKADQRAFARLNRLAQQRPLNVSEQARQQTLTEIYDRTLVRRAHASVLLKRRGYDLTDLSSMQSS